MSKQSGELQIIKADTLKCIAKSLALLRFPDAGLLLQPFSRMSGGY